MTELGSDKLNSSLDLERAVVEVLKNSKVRPRKFLESVDIAILLGVDSKHSEQSVKGSVVLPNGTGRKVKILVFTSNEEVKKIAEDYGVAYVGLDDLINKIEAGFLDFDCCIATPDVMQKISKVAKKLGPRGLMPSPKNGTVTNDVSKAISDVMKGRVDFKNDKAGIIHCLVGKVNFEPPYLIENIRSIIKAVKDSKPDGVKGKYVKRIYLSTTMGSSVSVDADTV